MRPPRFLPSIVISLFGIIVLLPILYMFLAPFVLQASQLVDAPRPLFEVRHLNLAKNSLGLALGTSVMSLILGVLLAFLIQRTSMPGKSVFRVIYIIPILIPPYIHAIVWGHVNPWIKQIFCADIHSLGGAIFVLTLAYFPFVTLTTISGLKSIDRNLEEAALLLCGRWHTVRKITLPLVLPHIFAGSIFVFTFAFIDFGVPDILRVKVFPVEIFVEFSAFYDERAAAFLSMPLIVITLVLVMLQRRYMHNRSYVQLKGIAEKTIEYPLGRMNFIACGCCVIICGLAAGLPVVVMLKVAGSLSNYIRVLSTSAGQIGYSLVLAAGGAVLAVLLAFPLSYFIERSKIKGSPALAYVTFIPLAIPAATLGIGLIKIWNLPVIDVIYGSSWIIVFGYVARFIPFAVITTSSGLKQVNPRAEEAAFLTSSRWTRVMRKIVMPLSRHSLITSLFIVFILSVGELGTTLLVIPPGRETIVIKIYNLMHYGAEQMVAALCVILIVILLVISGFLWLLHKNLIK
jgi:iron(III) transport system permease protein